MPATRRPRRRPVHLRLSRRRGATIVVAMLFLALMSCLAVGFYFAVNASVQVAKNERGAAVAQTAAESGLQFMRYTLSGLRVPAGTPASQLPEEVYAYLSDRLDDTANLGANHVALSGGVVSVPSVALVPPGAESSASFRATVRESAGRLRLEVVGTADATGATRTVRLDFAATQGSNPLLGAGVISRGAIHLHSNARIGGVSSDAQGNTLSTSLTANPTYNLDSNSTISGTASLVNPSGVVSLKSNAVIKGAVVKGAAPPQFPTVDTSAFEPYATNVLSAVGRKYDKNDLKNIRIKANTNPIFDSNIKIDGVIFIETPNVVEFSSNVQIRGVIAVQNNPTGNTNVNAIYMRSNVKMTGVDTLPATADFPAALRAMTGSLILAPRFALNLHSNAGTTGGCIVAGKIDMHSNANITVKGSVISLENATFYMHSNARVNIDHPATDAIPAGLQFDAPFAPLPDTYAEIN